MSETFHDYYAVLEVSPKATREEIKHAWLVKMRASHPDLHLDENEHYETLSKEINHAYSVLANPTSRAEFDIARSRVIAQKKKARAAAEKARQDAEKAKTPNWRERIVKWFQSSERTLGFGDKIVLTALVGVFTVFFVALIPWAQSGNALLAYLLGNGAAPSQAFPFWLIPLIGGGLFIFLQLLGKFFRSPVDNLAVLELLAIALACAASFLLPLQEYKNTVFFLLLAFGGFCVFRSFGEKARRITGTLLRGLFAVVCIAVYRFSLLVFKQVDELVAVGSFLLLAAFIIAWLCASFSSGNRES